MSVLAEVFQALQPLRTHKSQLPAKRVLPAIVITTVGGHDEMHLRGEAGLRRRIIQLDAWSSTETGASDYMEQARTKMLAATEFQVNSIGATSVDGEKDEEANLFRSSLEFAIWFQQ